MFVIIGARQPVWLACNWGRKCRIDSSNRAHIRSKARADVFIAIAIFAFACSAASPPMMPETSAPLTDTSIAVVLTSTSASLHVTTGCIDFLPFTCVAEYVYIISLTRSRVYRVAKVSYCFPCLCIHLSRTVNVTLAQDLTIFIKRVPFVAIPANGVVGSSSKIRVQKCFHWR